jgi:transcriptional regulator with XRE-family HTH domain/tetratricopeptide (TPR) repeat protein
VTGPTPNERIRALRHAHGWTQQQAADLVAAAVSRDTRRGRPTGIDVQWVSRIERGELRWPNADYRAALRAVYGAATDGELGLSGVRSAHRRQTPAGTQDAAGRPTRDTIGAEEDTGHDSDTGVHDEMKNRRELLHSLSLVSALVALPPDSGASTDRQGTVDAAELDDYERFNAHLWQVFGLVTTKHSVYPIVRQQLGQLTAALERPHTDAVRKRLCVLTGDLFQLAGEVFFDENRYTEAAHCYTLAASSSKEADAYDLWACALARHSFIGLYDRNFSGTAPMLAAASRLAQRGDSELSTRHWVAAVQAEVFAGLGDLDACNRALDTAEAVHGLSGQVHNGGWLRFDGSRLAEQRGACYTRLGRYDLAETALADALTRRLSPRRQGGVLTDLALLGIQRGDVDQVVTYGGTAVKLARHTGSGWVRRRLQETQERLKPLGSDARITELDDDIAALSHSTW